MEKDSLIEEWFRDFHSMMSELWRIQFLEFELHKRKLKYIKLKSTCKKSKEELLPKLTEDEIKEVQQRVQQIVKSHSSEDVYNARSIGEDYSWSLEEEEEVLVLFDKEGRATPNAIVFYKLNDRPSIFVDIAASVKNEPRNIGHPIVIAVIERYLRVLAGINDPTTTSLMPSKQEAMERLNKIFSALIESAKVERSKSIEGLRFKQALVSLAAKTYDESYFDSLWRILKEQQSQSFKRRGLTSNWLSRIKIRLNQEYPSVDHTKTLSFLEKSSNLPKKGGARALKNAFNAFENQLSIQSIKIYKSRALSFLTQFSSVSDADLKISEKEIDQMTTEWMRNSLGVGGIDNDLDLTESKLTWEFYDEGNKKKRVSSKKTKRDDG
jgi:hypothetical protein